MGADVNDGQPRGQIIGAISIRKRPAKVEDQAIPGHWDGDLLSGSKNSHIATLVERHSRFVSVVQSLITQMRMLDERLRKSLTWDRGQEFAAHKWFSMATNMATSVSDRLAAKTPPTRCSGT